MMTMTRSKDLLLLIDESEESKQCMKHLGEAGISYQILLCSDLYTPLLVTNTQLYRGLDRIQTYAQATGHCSGPRKA